MATCTRPLLRLLRLLLTAGCPTAAALASLPPLESASHRAALVSSVQRMAAPEVSALVDDLRAAGRCGLACEVLVAGCNNDQLPCAPTFDALAARLRRDGRLDEASEALTAFHRAGGVSNPSQSAALMAALAREGRTMEALSLHSLVRADNRTSAMLLTALLQAGEVAGAGRLASELGASLRGGGASPDLPLFNVMLQSLLRSGRASEASTLLSASGSSRLRPSARTLHTLLHSFVSAGELPAAVEAESLARQMASSGAAPDSYTLNALLRASAATGQPRRALALYRLLHRSHGVAPDSATFSLLAWALAPALAPVGDGPRAALLAREWARPTAAWPTAPRPTATARPSPLDPGAGSADAGARSNGCNENVDGRDV
ncbi:hypothetical protein EMIHUDRAFT_207727 [Emiliania huxleyi CCMP1516]|uniref:Pentatricopeptide repeat-containing protein-mitochondrial domain-containing protein n=2 Tax=Emiliania huxleyi TaxID=2903 RepID=A0A0D3JDW4_EMIH1|nr:hypothetical protein EMIHUDRAFT_207727 [Emiliania huxleyi CCMP1516]EOD21699.1 hypothetical protein EMIHUDRAFT_207727 [Emiliania huxleyi CCMP1516]|eukprot:XP_005774128.1 hypothetical protein EMIHUDRAFT_207727 [Emiliania huxleyi CCMP1516]